MTPIVLALVLFAAVLHATWNALVKTNDDRLMTMALLGGSAGLMALLLLPFFALPVAAAWPYLIAGTFIHAGYKSFLILAYGQGDFGQVYPIARGTAPLLTAFAGVFLLHEYLSAVQWIAIALVTGGIISLALNGPGALAHNLKGVFYALITACFIASYTIVDGIGARVSGDVHSFAVWLFFLDGIPLLLVAALLRRHTLRISIAKHWRVGAFAALFSTAGYWIILWALTVGAIAPVAALRETSIIFATVIAALVLKEGFGWQRIAAAVAVALGVYLLALAG
ncbi:EamA family transporter [bacterium AH-315-P15]|nr:EamA family transporter [bacterium AH-315-P15]